MRISARNQIAGTVLAGTKGATTSHVKLRLAGSEVITTSIREISQGAIARRNRRQAATAPASFLDVLGAIADSEEARGRELRKFADAARPFVASLSDAQKRRIPAFLGMTDHGGPGQPSGSL